VTSDEIWKPIYRKLIGDDDPASDLEVLTPPWEWYPDGPDGKKSVVERYGPFAGREVFHIGVKNNDSYYSSGGYTPYHSMCTSREDPRPYFYRLGE